MEIAYPSALLTFLLYISILVAVSVYSARAMARTKLEKYVDEFYTAGRGLGALIIAFMIAAGLCSAGTFLGGPGLLWQLGLGWGMVVMAQVFMNFYVLGEFGKKIGIIARRINARSFVDILRYRYENNNIIVIGTVLAMLIFLSAYASAQFVGGARLIETITGFPYSWGLLLYAGIVIVYTTFGGLRGAAMAILVQGIVMTVATIILMIFGISHAGGIEEMFHTMAARSPDFIAPTGSAHLSLAYIASLWVVFGLVISALPHGIMGAMVYKSTKALKRAIIIGGALVILWSFGLTLLCGIAGTTINPELEVLDHNLPFLAFESLPPAFAGLVLAGIGGAIQSTVGMMLIVISGALVNDVYKRYIKPEAAPATMKMVTGVTTGIIGIIVFAIAFTAPPALETIIIFAIGGLASAFFFPLLGLYWPRANQYGAVVSMCGGMAFYIISKQFVPSLTLGMDPIVMSLLLSGALMVGVSKMTPKPSKEVLNVFWGRYPKEG